MPHLHVLTGTDAGSPFSQEKIVVRELSATLASVESETERRVVRFGQIFPWKGNRLVALSDGAPFCLLQGDHSATKLISLPGNSRTWRELSLDLRMRRWIFSRVIRSLPTVLATCALWSLLAMATRLPHEAHAPLRLQAGSPAAVMELWLDERWGEASRVPVPTPTPVPIPAEKNTSDNVTATPTPRRTKPSIDHDAAFFLHSLRRRP